MSFSQISADSPYHDPPLTTLQTVIFTTGPFIFFWSTLRGYVSRNGPFPIFASITKYNSQLYAVFSAILSYMIYQSYFQPVQSYSLPFTIPLLHTDTIRIEPWMLGYAYHLSKIYEYIDIFNLVAQGIPIDAHMAFHHITMPYLTYFRIISMPSSASMAASVSSSALAGLLGTDDWRIFALANCVHNAVMYAYLGDLGPWLRQIIPITGWLQLVLGVATDGFWMYRTQGGQTLAGPDGMKSEEVTNRGIAILLLARYAMLYWDERTKTLDAEKGGVVGKTEQAGKVAEGGKEGREKKRE